MKRFVLLTTILLAFTLLLVVYSQSAGAPAAQPATASEANVRSAESWLDNSADARLFMDAYSISSLPTARWALDYPEDARLYLHWFRADSRQRTTNSIPDYPLDGQLYIEYYR